MECKGSQYFYHHVFFLAIGARKWEKESGGGGRKVQNEYHNYGNQKKRVYIKLSMIFFRLILCTIILMKKTYFIYGYNYNHD